MHFNNASHLLLNMLKILLNSSSAQRPDEKYTSWVLFVHSIIKRWPHVLIDEISFTFTITFSHLMNFASILFAFIFNKFIPIRTAYKFGATNRICFTVVVTIIINKLLNKFLSNFNHTSFFLIFYTTTHNQSKYNIYKIVLQVLAKAI